MALEDEASRGLQKFLQTNFDAAETCWKELFQHNVQPPAMESRRGVEATSSNQSPKRRILRRFERANTDTDSGKRRVACNETSVRIAGQSSAMKSRGDVEATSNNQSPKREHKRCFETTVTDTNFGKRRVAGNETSVHIPSKLAAKESRRDVQTTSSNQSPIKKKKHCSEATNADTNSGKSFVGGNETSVQIPRQELRNTYLYFLRYEVVSRDLQAYVRKLMPGCLAFRAEAGAGGDCLYHAIAAVLERLVTSKSTLTAHLTTLPKPTEFQQGAAHIVKYLRNAAVQGIAAWAPEELLDFF